MKVRSEQDNAAVVAIQAPRESVASHTHTVSVNRRGFLVLVGAAAAAAVLAACGSSNTPTATPAQSGASTSAATTGSQPTTSTQAASSAQVGNTAAAGGVLRLGVNADITSADPHLVAQGVDRMLAAFVFNGLTKYNDKMEALPDLATSWDTPDPTTYVFHLRPGVRFHNSRELTADDVVFSLQRILDPQTNSRYLAYLSDVASVAADNSSTVRVKLKQSSAVFLSNLADAKIVAKENLADIKQKPIGTGPFQLMEWIPNDHITLKKNGQYFEPGRPLVNEVRILPSRDPTSQVSALRAGTLDIINGINTTNADQVKGQPGIQLLVVQASTTFATIDMDNAHPSFNDPKARQALAYAVNKTDIVNIVYQGYGAVSDGPIPRAHWAYDPSIKDTYPYDLGKAKELFSAAGITPGTTFHYIAKAGAQDPSVLTGQILQQSLQKIGLNLSIDAVDANAAVAAMFPTGKTFQIGFVNPSREWDPDGLLLFYRTPNNKNYSNPDVDRLMGDARSATDMEKRKGLYAQVQKLLVQDIPGVVVGHINPVHALRITVKGLVSNYRADLDLLNVSVGT